MADNQPTSNGLSLRDLVLEVRADVKEIKENYITKEVFEEQVKRIDKLERMGDMARGAWLAVGVFLALVTSISSLLIEAIKG